MATWLASLQSLFLFSGCSFGAYSLTKAWGGTPATPPLRLQSPHARQTPSQVLQQLAQEAADIKEFDVYGDFEDPATYLRQFEAEVADELGKDDAVFMPSGVMAQSIALLIHHQSNKISTTETVRPMFACHSTSHLLLHEQEAYRELLQHEALVLQTHPSNDGSIAPSALDFATVRNGFHDNPLSTLILEVPHRELGGRVTSWSDMLQMRDWCREQGVAFHCDGARIFEASAAFPDRSLATVLEPFDSVYISFYKGLGGLSGAMLLGSRDFCDQARVWLRRFGGNLYTQLPYVVSARRGYRKHWSLPETSDEMLSFAQKRNQLSRIVQVLRDDELVSQIVQFDPPGEPHVCMVHGYLRRSVEDCEEAAYQVELEQGVNPIHRIRSVSTAPFPVDVQFLSMFEWNMGEANGRIPDGVFLKAWRSFAQLLLANRDH